MYEDAFANIARLDAGTIEAWIHAPALAARSACTLATNAEVSAAAGKPVDNGEITGSLGSACTWHAPSDSRIDVQIQKTPREYWTVERFGPDYRKVDGIGEKAYSLSELGGWKARGLSGPVVVCVGMDGGRASAAAATALPKASLKRAAAAER